jgi:hypothetical protein
VPQLADFLGEPLDPIRLPDDGLASAGRADFVQVRGGGVERPTRPLDAKRGSPQ